MTDLSQWVQHKTTCPKWNLPEPHPVWRKCTCGLDAALASQGVTEPKDEAIRCSMCDQEVPDVGDLVCIDCHIASQGAVSPQGDLKRALQFGQMRGAWTFDKVWTAWEEQEARIARAQMEPAK